MRPRVVEVRLQRAGDTLVLDPVDELTRGRYRRRLSHLGVSAPAGQPLVTLDTDAAADFLEDADLDPSGAKALELGGSIVRPMLMSDFDQMVGVTAD